MAHHCRKDGDGKSRSGDEVQGCYRAVDGLLSAAREVSIRHNKQTIDSSAASMLMRNNIHQQKSL